ncbi:threonine dehydratase biosynthetic [Klebsiella pneumoniae]|uniref:L-threonine dehydratase n=1 Tax=Klebsiella pneumoniae TaxID=573 RepID=A0A378FVG1_KLEPN|nr:threonine dehydratase biosynthetic [Klebsiella pneumoniae]
MVIAGQGTLALELLQQDAHIDRVFVPVGGGGLAAGVAVLIKQLMPQIKVIAVEAEDSACLKAALDAGHPVDLPRVGLFAEGVAVKRIGDETFRLCQEYLDDIITVDSDAICAAMKDLFEDVRAVAEPSGALALAGMKKYIAQHNIRGERLAHILSGANVNFHGLRYVSERCELGEQREALLAVTIPEEKGSFLKFCQLLGGRSVTEFNYRFADAKDACIFVGVRLSRGLEERKEILQLLNDGGYSVVDLSDDEMAKLHVRYMVGRPAVKSAAGAAVQLRVSGIAGGAAEIPAYPWHPLEYFTVPLPAATGTDYGRVLAAFELGEHEPDFETRLNELGYECHDETHNPAFRFFPRGLVVGKNFPESINKRLMQPLFLCANTQLKRRLLIAALQDHHPVAYRLRTVLQHHFRQQRHAASQGDHRHHRFVPADGGVDRRIADFMPPKPQLDAPTYRPLVGHDKGHCRPVGALDGHLVAHRAGKGRGN